MTTLTLDIPDSAKELALWLERQLLGPNLGNIVEELRSVHGVPLEERSLRDALGDDLPGVLRTGVTGLSASQLGALLTDAHLLLELQEQVCIGGGDYWRKNVEVDPTIEQAVQRGRFRLAGMLAMREAGAPQAGTAPAAPARRPLRPWLVSAATAAVLLLAVGICWQALHHPPVAQKAWGWQKPEVLADDLPPQAYLNRLANAGEEWFAERPGSAVEVADRLLQLRRGCTSLILAPKEKLSREDRDWVNEKCKAWAATLDQHLKDLEAGGNPVEVRNQTDATVRKLIEKLRRRAAGA